MKFLHEASQISGKRFSYNLVQGIGLGCEPIVDGGIRVYFALPTGVFDAILTPKCVEEHGRDLWELTKEIATTGLPSRQLSMNFNGHGRVKDLTVGEVVLAHEIARIPQMLYRMDPFLAAEDLKEMFSRGALEAIELARNS